MSFTTTDLIASIKRRASVPTAQNLFAPADFIAFANDEIQDNLAPLIMSAREDFFVANYDHTVVSGTTAYQIPSASIGGGLRDVQYIEGDQIKSVPRLFEEDRFSATDNGFGFFILGNNIVLAQPLTSGTLRLVYHRRPNTLVLMTACGQIESIDTGTNQVVITSTPATFTTGISIDFIKDRSGFDTLGTEAIAGVSGTTITFAALPDGLAVGDWLALEGKSPIPQVPQEAHSLLAQMVTIKCLEAMSKFEAMKLAEQKLQMMKENFISLISPRIVGEAKVIRPGGLSRLLR